MLLGLRRDHAGVILAGDFGPPPAGGAAASDEIIDVPRACPSGFGLICGRFHSVARNRNASGAEEPEAMRYTVRVFTPATRRS